VDHILGPLGATAEDVEELSPDRVSALVVETFPQVCVVGVVLNISDVDIGGGNVSSQNHGGEGLNLGGSCVLGMHNVNHQLRVLIRVRLLELVKLFLSYFTLFVVILENSVQDDVEFGQMCL